MSAYRSQLSRFQPVFGQLHTMRWQIGWQNLNANAAKILQKGDFVKNSHKNCEFLTFVSGFGWIHVFSPVRKKGGERRFMTDLSHRTIPLNVGKPKFMTCSGNRNGRRDRDRWHRRGYTARKHPFFTLDKRIHLLRQRGALHRGTDGASDKTV